MTYSDYIEQATADGYPLRYYLVKRRIPALPAFGLIIVVLLTLNKGCSMIHASAPTISYRALEILTAMVFVIFFFAVAYFAKALRVGYVDFTEEELLFLDAELNIRQRVAIAGLRTIWNTREPDQGFAGVIVRGRFLKITLAYKNGSEEKIELLNTPFLPDQHERMYVTAGYLLEHLMAGRAEH